MDSTRLAAVKAALGAALALLRRRVHRLRGVHLVAYGATVIATHSVELLRRGPGARPGTRKETLAALNEGLDQVSHATVTATS